MHIERVSFGRGETLSPAVYAIGNFDGVHRGHTALIHEARRLGLQYGLPVGVITFDPHPQDVLGGTGGSHPRLTPLPHKLRLLAQQGIDRCVLFRFDDAVAALLPEVFIEEALIKMCHAYHVVVGDNFTFGHQGKGTASFLSLYGEKIHLGVTSLPLIFWDGRPVSSRRIRDALKEGDVQQATTLLEAPYTVYGIVQKGAGRGHTLGFSTANLVIKDYYLPKSGVYGVSCVLDNTPYSGIANLGVRPTFAPPLGEPAPIMLEVHILDDCPPEFYGQELIVSFLHFIREEKKFDSVEALKSQIQQDITLFQGISAL